MIKKILCALAILLSTSFIFVQNAIPGISGKIAGRVIEAGTRTPIPGANVVIAGTMMGAASDMNGQYTILNVPPGVYDMKAMVVGYATITVNDVRVRIDQTTRVDFTLSIEVLEGETVIVVADKKPVKADVSTSVASLSSDEVETLPMTSVEDVIGLQAGVESGLVIRGGDADETLFQMDGVTLRDPRNNQPITGIALSAIQEVSVERGGFNAEYGQVRSGIVNVVTKEGGTDHYYGNFVVKYSPPGKKYFGMSPFDQNSTMLKPYLDPDVCWTGTKNGAWDEYTQRQYPEFDGWNQVSRQLMTDNDPDNNLSPAAAQQLFLWQHRRTELNEEADYNIDAGFGGPVPVIGKMLGDLRFFTSFKSEREMLLVPLSRPDYRDYYWSLKMNSNINSSMKLTLNTMIGKNKNIAQNEAGLDNNAEYIRTPEQIAYQISNMDYPRATDSRLFCNSYFSIADVYFRTFSAKLTHVLGQKSYYDASIEHITRKYDTGPIDLRNPTALYEIAPGLFANEAPFGYSPEHDPGIDGMMTGGHTSTARDNSVLSSTTFKIDYSNQINFNNLIKAGVEFTYGDLKFDYGDVKEIYIDGNTYVKMNKYPLRGAIYVQDKLEVEGLIVNAGLRLDYSNANTEWPDVDDWNKEFYSSNYNSGVIFTTKESKSNYSFSPRLGISHPITENSKLFFNYGHFKMLPTYEQMFRLSRGGSNEVFGIGNPDLTLEKTIAYELGYDHSINDTYLIQLAAFYRDISDQRDYTRYTSADASINYLLATNNSYEDIRGFELTLRKPAGMWWVGFINYTYQVNTMGNFDRAEIYQDPKAQREYDRNTRVLYQNRPIPQPYARAKLSFFTPLDFGPNALGMYPLGDWNFNIVADWRAGQWVTWNPSRKLNVAQNVQAKDWHNLLLRITKRFKVNKFEFTFFVDINNLFNNKTLSLNSFYDSHDYFDYFESLHLPRSNDYDNIVGDDKVGEYRKTGVAYQPIEQVGNVNTISAQDINDEAIYYDSSSRKYMNFVGNTWQEVDKSRMDKILDDKAYIDMPNHTYFTFLNPRDIFFGLKLTFELK